MKNFLFFSLLCLFSIQAIIAQSQELNIYPFYKEYAGFLSLSDRYEFDKYEDSIYVIDSKFLGSVILDNQGYHVLNRKKRKLFLNRIQISENDTLYVYHYPSDSLICFSIDELKIVAQIDPEVSTSPILPFHYMIGFELKELIQFPSEALAFIGKENIFIRNGLKPMIWEQVDNSNFPFIGYPRDPDWFKSHSRAKTYQIEAMGYTFYLQDLKWTSRLSARHLVVMEAESEAVVLNKVYDVSESKELRSITIKNEEHNFKSMQWMGNLFKDKPYVLFGFQSHSFGCPSIDFISKEEESIVIRCDNRH